GIGSGRIAMLASYGIETAADERKNKILRIPGFGDVLAGRLVEWRRKHERNFRFNPNEGLDPRDIAALNRDLAIKTQHLVWTLQQGPVKLQRASREIAAARARLMPVLERAWTALKLAEARRDAL